jgi:transposase
MKRTRKWAFVAQEATRLTALGLSPRETASRLGVNKATVTRWIASGKLTPPGEKPRAKPAKVKVKSRRTPSEWAREIRKAYDLDATDDQLVTLAQAALAMTIDSTAAAQLRLQAAGRFQALVKQLSLVTRRADEPPAEKPESKSAAAPRPSAAAHRADPRKLLLMPNAK